MRNMEEKTLNDLGGNSQRGVPKGEKSWWVQKYQRR